MNALDWIFIGLVCYVGLFGMLNVLFPKPRKLWQRGRWALIFEPADLWVGGYYDREERRLYLIVVPTLPLRYQRKDAVRAC